MLGHVKKQINYGLTLTLALICVLSFEFIMLFRGPYLPSEATNAENKAGQLYKFQTS